MHLTVVDAAVKLLIESYIFISLEILSFCISFASYLLLYSIELE